VKLFTENNNDRRNGIILLALGTLFLSLYTVFYVTMGIVEVRSLIVGLFCFAGGLGFIVKP
jgi:hypothetical protein